MTERNLNMVKSYERATKTTLEECYGNCSKAKKDADVWCRNKMAELNGYGYRIMSYNTMMFTCGFRYEKNGKQFLNVETAKNSYTIEL